MRLRGVARLSARGVVLGDLLGVVFLAAFVVLYLSPALKDGANFGPADLGRGLSLLTHIVNAPTLHNSINGDQITQGVPWNTVDWKSVHAGELPLWNSLSGTGLPQMFNFESAPLSLPTLIGYLAPLHASFLVTIAAKLFVAGTGVFLACRVLGTGPLAATFGGVTFMLAGSFAGWLGWAVSGPSAWGGYLVAGVVVAYRSRRGPGGVVLLALAVAFSLYAGFPETYVLLALGLGVLLVVTGLMSLALRRAVALNGVLRIGAGVVAGGLLAAPLLLPGASLLSGSARNGKNAATGIPLHLATLLFAQGYFGLPTKGSYWFGQVNYYETAAYVGVVALVFALLALAVSFRRPVVIGLGVATLASFLTIYQLGSGAPVQKLLSRLGLSAVALQRMQTVLELLVAVLAGLGLEIAVTRWRERGVRVASALSALVVALVIAALWSKVGTARALPSELSPPSIATLESLRRSSLIWPSAEIALVLVLVGIAFLAAGRASATRAATFAGAGLVLAQASFLLFAGVGVNSYSHDPYPVTPAVAKLQSVVGSKLLALDAGNIDCRPALTSPGGWCGVRRWAGAGFYPEMNIGYGIDELGLHDPVIPQAYFDAWPVPNAMQVTAANLNLFVPDVDTVSLAREYGVSYVLVLPGLPAPAGMRLVATLAGERLYAVPGAARFSFGGGASVRGYSQPSDNRYVVTVRAPHAATLDARLTDVTGWHATANGRAIPLSRAPGDLLRATVPAGTRTVTFTYWPRRFSEGLALAALAVLALLAWAVAAGFSAGARGRARRRAGGAERARW